MSEFKISKINSDLLLIEELGYKEHCNIFVFAVDDHGYVFDCGTGVWNLRDLLKSIGFRKFTVLVTHSHFDHASGLVHFQKDSAVIPPPILKKLMQGDIGANYLVADDFDKVTDFQTAKRILETPFPESPKLLSSPISFGKYNFKAINLPGHTDDSFVYYDEGNKILIGGDVLYRGELYYKDINKYLESLLKLAEMPIRILLPGHNEVLKGKKFQGVLKQQIKKSQCLEAYKK